MKQNLMWAFALSCAASAAAAVPQEYDRVLSDPAAASQPDL